MAYLYPMIQQSSNNDASGYSIHLLKEGMTFGAFEVLSYLGTGGMAEVYLVYEMKSRIKCALKVMKPGVYQQDEIFKKRFEREISIGSSISHPNLVKIYGGGQDQNTGLLYIVMEYLQGKTLDVVSQKRRFSFRQLRRVALEMSDALHALHENNIVHRDVKPSNIMRCRNGSLRLMDFGIAKIESTAGQEMTLTYSNVVVGTPDFASPEQLMSAHDADIRSDIYSLGATLYYLATGKAPYSGETSTDIMLQVCDKDVNPQPLGELRPDLPPDFIALVEKMMNKSPLNRPPTFPVVKTMMAKVRAHFKLRNVLDVFSSFFPRFVFRVIPRLIVIVVLLIFLSKKAYVPLSHYYWRCYDCYMRFWNWMCGGSASQEVEKAIDFNEPLVLPGEYLVVNLATGKVWTRNWGPDLKSADCRTTEMWFRKIPKTKDYFIHANPYSRQEYSSKSPFLKNLTIDNDFYVGVFEVTQAQFSLIMDFNPSFNTGKNTFPVENVSYEMVRGDFTDTIAPDSFLGRLRSRCGNGRIPFDLPTQDEAFYIYAAYNEKKEFDKVVTEGVKQNFWDFLFGVNHNSPVILNNVFFPQSIIGIDKVANTNTVSVKVTWVADASGTRKVANVSTISRDISTTTVGRYMPNVWGLYDVIGNVSELCKYTVSRKNIASNRLKKEVVLSQKVFSIPVFGGDYKESFYALFLNATKSKLLSDCTKDDKSETTGFRVYIIDPF